MTKKSKIFFFEFFQYHDDTSMKRRKNDHFLPKKHKFFWKFLNTMMIHVGNADKMTITVIKKKILIIFKLLIFFFLNFLKTFILNPLNFSISLKKKIFFFLNFSIP